MKIIITESQLKLINEGIDVLHFLKNLIGKDEKLNKVGEDQNNAKFQKIVNIIWKSMSKSNEYQNLTLIKKHLKKLEVFGSQNHGKDDYTNYVGWERKIEWYIQIKPELSSWFNPKNDKDFFTESRIFENLFNETARKLGLTDTDVLGANEKIFDNRPNLKTIKIDIKFIFYFF